MREEKWKRAVEKIAAHAGLATTASACEKALKQDTAEGYREALQTVKRAPNSEYAVNVSEAERALDE